MFLVYNTVPDKEIAKGAKETLPKLLEWFEKNPKRKDCDAQTWYGKRVKIRRDHAEEDLLAAAHAAMKDPKLLKSLKMRKSRKTKKSEKSEKSA